MMAARIPTGRREWPSAAVLIAGLGAVETLSQRRRRVEEMSAEQLDELFRNEQQFRALSPQEQQRIRDLHEQIESDPDREKLLATMNRYCKWLRTQPPFRREKLLRQEADAGGTRQDRQRILGKASPEQGFPSGQQEPARPDRLARSLHRGARPDRLVENHPVIAGLPRNWQQAALRENLLRRWQSADPKGPMSITESETARLLAGLSPELRAKLETKKPVEQVRLIAGWLLETASHELDEELADYFENVIGEEDRDKLMSLPSSEMYDSLRSQYSAHLRQSQPVDRLPRPRSGRRPGSPRGSPPGWRPENRDEKDPRAGKDFQGNPISESAGDRPPFDKRARKKRRGLDIRRRPGKAVLRN